jgi:hypothetical protein
VWCDCFGVQGRGGDSRKSESERLKSGKAASISVASVAAYGARYVSVNHIGVVGCVEKDIA